MLQPDELSAVLLSCFMCDLGFAPNLAHYRGRLLNRMRTIFWWSVKGYRFCSGLNLPFPIDKASRR